MATRGGARQPNDGEPTARVGSVRPIQPGHAPAVAPPWAMNSAMVAPATSEFPISLSTSSALKTMMASPAASHRQHQQQSQRSARVHMWTRAGKKKTAARPRGMVIRAHVQHGAMYTVKSHARVDIQYAATLTPDTSCWCLAAFSRSATRKNA